ncbi:MAG: Dabb family protein [Bacteroidia bacterium]|nr:Dabb family protein [Bacteroidia bacterium]
MSISKYLIISLFILLGLFSFSCNSKEATAKEAEEKTETSMEEKKEKLLRHVVLFKFKDEASKADVDQLNQAFNALPEAIPVIKDFEWGINDSPENFHQGFTHCYLLSFASEEDRDSVYTPHPQHQAFVKRLQPHLEKVFVVDYWTQEKP